MNAAVKAHSGSFLYRLIQQVLQKTDCGTGFMIGLRKTNFRALEFLFREETFFYLINRIKAGNHPHFFHSGIIDSYPASALT